jgi:hypothetical protein
MDRRLMWSRLFGIQDMRKPILCFPAFHFLPPGVGAAIAAATHRVIRPGGAFLVYQFRAKARDFMSPHFKRIDKAMEYWNIPPCFLFWAWKD